MPDINRSTLFPVLQNTANPAGYCIATILAWAMVIDGDIDDEEIDFLRHMSKSLDFDTVIEIVDGFENSFIDVQLACEFLIKALPEREDHYKILEIVILMIIADGRFTFAEMQVLFLMADVFRISPETLNEIYREVTNKNIPTPPDYSSKKWWQQREQQKSQKTNQQHEPQKNSEVNVVRIKALAVLGLDEGATNEEIRSAYLRMAQVHHPDKFHSLGEEAVKAAEKSFSRIHESYEYLRAGHA